MHGDQETYRFPASSAQERFWVLAELAPRGGEDPYGVRTAVRVTGHLDPGILQAALDAVVRQHDSLRTNLVLESGRLWQHVRSVGSVVLARCDARPTVGTQAARRDADRRRDLALRGLGAPFDLGRDTLLRALLVHRDTAEHELHLTVHHAVCDGWSLAVVLDDLAAAYAALADGRRPAEPAAVQHPDLVVWQREHLSSTRLGAGLRSFREELDGVGQLALPTDRSGELEDDARAATCDHVVAPGKWRELVRVASARGTTPATLVTAALGVALARLCSTDDLCLGVVVSGRARAETRRMVGMLMNTLPVRFRFDSLDEDASVAEAVDHGSQRVTAVLARQQVPYAEVLRSLGGPGDAPPLFRVLVVFQELPPPRTSVPGLQMAPLDDATRTARADLALVVSPGTDGSCRLSLEHPLAQVDPETAASWLALLLEVLDDVVHGETRPWRTCGVPQAVAEEAAPSVTEPAGTWERVAERGRTDPGSLAVLSWEGSSGTTTTSTTAELLVAVDALRTQLRRHGLGSGHRLAVHLPRGRDLVVALLACLAEGTTYVPLDPSLPEERRRAMSRAAGVCAVLEPGVGSSCLEVLAPCGAPRASASRVHGEDVSHIMFTSGSTGLPKAVEVRRDALDAVVAWTADVAGIGPGDRWGAVSSTGFDISLVELLCPLVTGGTTVVLPQHATADGRALEALLDEARVRVVQATPSTWQLLRRAGAVLAPDLRVLTGGEALPEDLARWLRREGSAQAPRRVTSFYGPTEATVWVSASEVGEEPVDLGRTLPRAGWQVLDSHDRPVARGGVGELYLTGRPLAAGYRGRPRETACAFLPVETPPGARRYRTGDRVRVLSDGRLRYVGRDDGQVKVRGHRIELGELESVLSAHPRVLEAAATVVRHGEDDLRLVAAVVLEDRPEVTDLEVDELRVHLRRRLPAAAVPRVVVLDALPRTPAGKVDRRALERASQLPAAAQAGPADASLRGSLRALFEDLLDVRVDRPDASFFDLGGHSLLAASLLQRIEQQHGIAVPLRRFFDSPSIDALAAHLEERMANSTGAHRDREELGALARLDEESLDRMLSRLTGAAPEGSGHR